jgi:hypothetical protein
MKIKKVVLKNKRIAYIGKSKIGDENFDNFFWSNVDKSLKLKSIWQMIVDACILRNECEKLIFRKEIKIRNKKDEIIKTIKINGNSC